MIELLNLKTQYSLIKTEIGDAISEVLQSGNFVMGENVAKFEQEIADYIGVKHAIAVANGTDALMLSLRALKVGLGDEVITSPYTFFSSAETASVLGAVPIFADICKDTYCIDAAEIEKHITEKTKAIIPVHIFGQMCDMDSIMAISEKYDIPVIEDACQAIGAEYKGKKAGSFGKLSAFSFFPTKNLGGYGDGGMIVTNDDELASDIRIMRIHGSAKKYMHVTLGINSRLDEIQAAVLRAKLKYLDKWNEQRRHNAHTFNEGLNGVEELTIPKEADYGKHIYHQYTIKTGKRDELKKFLSEKGISSGIYYPLPLHLQQVYEKLEYKRGDYPISENLSEEALSLPIYPELNSEELQYIIASIQDFYKKI